MLFRSWKWSSGSLFPDAKRFLDEQDPDEVWVACVGILNRSLIENKSEDHSRCLYWVGALQRRLERSELARQMQSKGIWNLLAFETYSLLKCDPSFLSELANRFGNMRRTCAGTPAEKQIAPIFQMIEKARSLT